MDVDRLSSDIAGLTRWMQLTRREDDIRHALARAIMAEISQAEGDIEWVMQGSQTTGLATSTSDVDLAFTVPSNSETKPGRRGPNTPRTRHVQKRRLHDKLIRMSKFLGWHGFEDFVLVSSKYPLLRATHQASGIKFQLVMVESQPAQRERVKMYLEEYPHLRGVYCVLRAALAARVGLFEPMEGGLGSYPLLILIVLAFKTAKLSRTESAAIALKAVLDFVITWDTNETAYVVDPVEALQKTQGKPVPNLKLKRIIKEDATVYAKHRMAEADLARPWQPCYLEPDNLLNNLGKNAYRWRDIKMTFRALNHDIDRYLSAAEITNSHAATGLASFFGRSLEKYRDKRAQLEVWAMTQDGGEALSLIRQQKLPETVARPRKDTSSVT